MNKPSGEISPSKLILQIVVNAHSRGANGTVGVSEAKLFLLPSETEGSWKVLRNARSVSVCVGGWCGGRVEMGIRDSGVTTKNGDTGPLSSRPRA